MEDYSYRSIDNSFDPVTQNSIETGYFVFTMMPSLRCDLNCPHCYLTLDQRRNSPIMSVEELQVACEKVDQYYKEKSINNKYIVCYWYGGEPTQMGQKYMLDAFEMIANVFSKEKGYQVRHEVLTSLLTIDDSWFEIFDEWCEGHFQTSFDGLMRGKGYMKKWDKKIRKAINDFGMDVSTISVVNNEILEDGPRSIMDYLSDIGVDEASFLPFMLNENNRQWQYEQFAPPMSIYSDFMIELNKVWEDKVSRNEKAPSIGQMYYSLTRKGMGVTGNMPHQTLFLLPDGDFVLPDYTEGYLEYMKSFGNIFNSDFNSILKSRPRRDYLRRQYTRNYNQECMECEFMDACIMEFWKENRQDDDCFGAKKYIQWLHERSNKKPDIYGISSEKNLIC